MYKGNCTEKLYIRTYIYIYIYIYIYMIMSNLFQFFQTLLLIKNNAIIIFSYHYLVYMNVSYIIILYLILCI